MNKTNVEVYGEVLRDISQSFEGAENFIKQQIEEICDWKKISVEVLYISCAFKVVTYVNLPVSWKTFVCYCYVNKSRQSLTHFTKQIFKSIKQKLLTLSS